MRANTGVEMRKEVDIFDGRVGFAITEIIDNDIGMGNETHRRKE
mgnify:CR=1 FL=1